MRKHIASVLLTASVFAWGIWCGGQIFNELMVIPIWSASPPESMKAYSELPNIGGSLFFPVVGTLFFLFALSSAIASWKSARRAKKWLALSAGTAIVLFGSLIFYLAPLVGSMFKHSIAGDLPAAEIVAGVGQWKFGNRIRLVVECTGFVFSIIALRVWSAESQIKGEIND